MIVAYVAAYRFTPRRYSYIGLDLEHARQFGHRWELYFYYPAGWAESLLVRARPSLYNRYPKCPQIVVLVFWDNRILLSARMLYSFRFHAGPVPPPIEEIFPPNTDILEYAANKKQHGKFWPNGTIEDRPQTVTCKYYDCRLDWAEQFLIKVSTTVDA